MNLVFKNVEGFTALRCPKCGKLYFHKYAIPKEYQKRYVFKCCECGVELEYLDITTDKIEIEL